MTDTRIDAIPDYSVCGMSYAAVFNKAEIDEHFIRAAELAISERDRRFGDRWPEDLPGARNAADKQREQQQAALAAWLHSTHPDIAMTHKLAVRTRVKVEPGEQAWRYVYVSLEKLR